MKLGEQLFVGSEEPCIEKFQEVSNEMGMKKPIGGFWTSSFINKNVGSMWVQWCLYQDFEVPIDGGWHCWSFSYEDDIRIYHIDNSEDLIFLFDKYGYLPLADCDILKSLDFVKMKEDYDCIHLTIRGERICRFFPCSADMSVNLYGWDCESCLWLNYKFKEVKYEGKLYFKKGM